MERDFTHPELDKHSRRLALSIIEKLMEEDSVSELTGLAYRESVWILYFIQDRYGISGIRQVLQHFAKGKDSRAVLADAFQLSVPEFYKTFRKWHETDAGRIVEQKKRARRKYDERKRVADAHTTLPDGRVIPKATIRKPTPGDASERKKREQEVSKLIDDIVAWHRYYSAKVRPLKKSLSAVVKNFRGQSSVPLGDACQQLIQEARDMLSDKKILACPEQVLKDPLLKTLQHFNKMGLACVQGESAIVLYELEKAERQLQDVATVLSLYGLSP